MPKIHERSETGAQALPFEQAFEGFYNRGIVLWGHGTLAEKVEAVLREGLWISLPKLQYTASVILNPTRDRNNSFSNLDAQIRNARKDFEYWPYSRSNQQFKDIVLVGIPAGPTDASQFDVITPKAPQPRVIEGREYPYVVDPRHIPGYINTDTGMFYPNRYHHFKPDLSEHADERFWVLPDATPEDIYEAGYRQIGLRA